MIVRHGRRQAGFSSDVSYVIANAINAQRFPKIDASRALRAFSKIRQRCPQADAMHSVAAPHEAHYLDGVIFDVRNLT